MIATRGPIAYCLLPFITPSLTASAPLPYATATVAAKGECGALRLRV